MNVSFYVNKSPTIKVNKDLGEAAIKTVSIDIPDSVDVVNPVLIIDDSYTGGILPSEVNYMVCGAPLSRSYFITAMDYTIAKRIIVAGHVDVLSTYSDRLTTTTLNYVRGAGDPTEMDDVSYPISDYMVEEYFPMTTWTDIFSAGGDGRQYLLRTICSDQAETPTYVSINTDQYFWAYPYKDVVHNGDGTDTTYYYCFKTSNPKKDYVPELFFVEDITHYTQIQNLDYVQVGSGVGSDVYQFVWPGPGWGSGANNALMGYKGQLNEQKG